MRNILNVFGQSPLSLLYTHMQQVQRCILKTREMVEAILNQKDLELQPLADQISELEHGADVSKLEMRSLLGANLFMAYNRQSIQDVLVIQDQLADICENIAVLLSTHAFKINPSLKLEFTDYVALNFRAAEVVGLIVKELQELSHSSFGGSELQKIKLMVEQVAFVEHEVDMLKRSLYRRLYEHAQEIPYHTFYLWMRLIDEMRNLSDIAEKLAYRIRYMIDT